MVCLTNNGVPSDLFRYFKIMPVNLPVLLAVAVLAVAAVASAAPPATHPATTATTRPAADEWLRETWTDGQTRVLGLAAEAKPGQAETSVKLEQQSPPARSHIRLSDGAALGFRFAGGSAGAKENNYFLRLTRNGDKWELALVPDDGREVRIDLGNHGDDLSGTLFFDGRKFEIADDAGKAFLTSSFPGERTCQLVLQQGTAGVELRRPAKPN